MSTPMDDDDDTILAAEYVLRLLTEEEERAFEARLVNEPALMKDVAAWTSRLSGLDDEVEEVAPRAAVKAGLQDRMFGPIETPPVPFWRRLGLWQGVSFASLVLAGFMTWQVLQAPQPGAPDPGQLFLTEISSEDQSLRVLAVYDSATNRLQINRTAGEAAEGRVMELWAIAGDDAPVSLGVLPETQTAGVTLPEDLRPEVAGLTLAISDEPPGGSPTGQPTGDVLALGQVSAL